MSRMVKKCFRCGKCCDNYLGLVPKERTDNLSPNFLRKIKPDKVLSYLETHSELMGHPCKWLCFDGGIVHCEVYPHRSSDCRNYPEGDGDCRVGKCYKEKQKVK